MVQPGHVMNAEERLLGFDCRRGFERVAADWDAKRREEYLFRTEVVQPLSTDTTVWPAVLASDLRPGNCIGHQDLWSDLQCLQTCLHTPDLQPSAEAPLIAITLHLSEKDKMESDFWKSAVPQTSPPVRNETWPFVGYDVSDRWLLSGLSNCGFVPGKDDKEALRREWSDKLNQYHLYANLEHATQFRELSNRRVAEHCPFFVFGIWIIPSDSS